MVEPEAEVDESSKVDCCASVRESDLVAGDAAEADFAAAASDEPGDRAFDHWAVLSVGVGERGCAGVSSCRGEYVVMFVDGEVSPSG